MSQESNSQKGVLSDEELYKLILKLEGKKTEEISQNIKPLLEGLGREGFIALLNKAVYAEALNNTFFRESSMAKVLVKIALEAEMENEVFQAFRNIEHANQKVYNSVIGNEEGFKNLYRVILIKEDVSASELKQKHQQLLGMSPDRLSDFVGAVERVQAENIARSPQVQNVSTNNAVPKQTSTPKQTSKPWWPDFRKILKLKPNISGQDIVNFINDHKPSLPAFLKERPKGVFSRISFKSILKKMGITKEQIKENISNSEVSPTVHVRTTISDSEAKIQSRVASAKCDSAIAITVQNERINTLFVRANKGVNEEGKKRILGRSEAGKQELTREQFENSENKASVKFAIPAELVELVKQLKNTDIADPNNTSAEGSIYRMLTHVMQSDKAGKTVEDLAGVAIDRNNYGVTAEEFFRQVNPGTPSFDIAMTYFERMLKAYSTTSSVSTVYAYGGAYGKSEVTPVDPFPCIIATIAAVQLENSDMEYAHLCIDAKQNSETLKTGFFQQFLGLEVPSYQTIYQTLQGKEENEDYKILKVNDERSPYKGKYICRKQDGSFYTNDSPNNEVVILNKKAYLKSLEIKLKTHLHSIGTQADQINQGKEESNQRKIYHKATLFGAGAFANIGGYYGVPYDIAKLFFQKYKEILETDLELAKQYGVIEFPIYGEYANKAYEEVFGGVTEINGIKIAKGQNREVFDFTHVEQSKYILSASNPGDANTKVSNELYHGSVEASMGENCTMSIDQNAMHNEAVLNPRNWLAVNTINNQVIALSQTENVEGSIKLAENSASDLPFAAVTQTESMKEHAAVRGRSDSGEYVSLAALSTPSTDLMKEPKAIREAYAAILNGINNQSLREAFIQKKIEKFEEHMLQDPSQYTEEKLRAFVDIVNTALNSEKGFNRNNQEEIIKEAGLPVFFGLYAFEFPDDGNPQFVDKGPSPEEIKAAEEARIAAEKQAAERIAGDQRAQENLAHIRETIEELKQSELQTPFYNTREIIDEETAVLRAALTSRIEEGPSVNAPDQIQDIKSVSVNSALEEILRKENPEQIADLLMQKSHQLFLSLDPQEVVLGTDKYLEANPGASSGMLPMVDYKNQLTEAVYLAIKNAPNDEERTKIGANLVNAAVIARDKGDYQTLLAFVVAFQKAKKDFGFHKTLNIDNEGQKEYELSTLLTGEGDIGELMKMQYDNNRLIVVPCLQVFNRALELTSSEKNQNDIISRINTMKGAASLPSALKQHQETLRPYWDAVLLSLEMADKNPELCVYKLQNLYNAMKSLGMDPDKENVVEGLEAMYGRISPAKHQSLAMVKQLALNSSDQSLIKPLELQNPQVKFIRNFANAFNTTNAVPKVPKHYANDKRAKKFSKMELNFAKLNDKKNPFAALKSFGVEHTAVILGRYDKTRNLPIDLVVRYIINHPETAADFLKKPSFGSRNFRAEICRNPDLIYQLIDSGNLEILYAIKGDPDNNKPGLLESRHLKIAADEKNKLSIRLKANIATVKLKTSFSIIDTNAIEQLKQLEQTLEKQDTLDKKYQEFNNLSSRSRRLIDGLLSFKENVSASTELTSEAKKILLASIDEKYNSYNAKFQELVAKFKDEVELPYQAAHAKKSSDSAINASAYEMIGKRTTQEDAVIHTSIAEEFGDLSFDSQKDLLNKTFQKMQEQTDSLENEKSKDKKPGSTAIVCAIQGKKIVTATVGDSAAYVVIKDKEGNIVECHRLNKKLHDLHNTEERARISNFIGKELKEGAHRLVTGIAVTRGLGDKQHEAGGLIHDPDIYSEDINIPNGGNAFVVVSCDGLSEKAKGGDDSAYIKNLLVKCGTDDLENLPERLAKAAYEDGSQDNISVLVTPLESKSSTAKLVGVFDGHSGNEVSHMLQEDFVSEFNNLLLKPEYASEISERRRERLNDEADKIASKAEITKEITDLVELKAMPMTSPEALVVKAISVKELQEVIESPERLKEILETNPEVVMPLINLLEKLQKTETADLDEQARQAQELQIIIGNLAGLAEAGSYEAADALMKHYLTDQFFDAELCEKWVSQARNILSVETQKYEVEITRIREENQRNFKGCIKALDKINSPAYKAMLSEAFERRFNSDPAGRIPLPNEIDAFVNKANQLLEKGLTYQQHEDLIKEHKVEFLRIRNPKVFGDGIRLPAPLVREAAPSAEKDKKVNNLWEKAKKSNPPPAPPASPTNKN